jgi:hypothetical protein
MVVFWLATAERKILVMLMPSLMLQNMNTGQSSFMLSGSVNGLIPISWVCPFNEGMIVHLDGAHAGWIAAGVAHTVPENHRRGTLLHLSGGQNRPRQQQEQGQHSEWCTCVLRDRLTNFVEHSAAYLPNMYACEL